MSELLYSGGEIEEQLEKYGSYASNTVGYSMKPLFSHKRDMVIISPLTEPPKKYDVVLYPKGDGNYILHRIVGVRRDFYIIRGDNTYIDERVPKENIIGVLTAYNRCGKSHKTTDLSYRLYSRFWCFIYPLRYIWHKLIELLVKLKHKIFKK